MQPTTAVCNKYCKTETYIWNVKVGYRRP